MIHAWFHRDTMIFVALFDFAKLRLGYRSIHGYVTAELRWGPRLLMMVSNQKLLAARDRARRFLELRRLLRLWPHYFVITSMDCDGTESCWAARYPTYWHAEKELARLFEDREGPIHVERCSKAEFLSFRSYTVDRGLEAFENGHPSCLHFRG